MTDLNAYRFLFKFTETVEGEVLGKDIEEAEVNVKTNFKHLPGFEFISIHENTEEPTLFQKETLN